MKVELQVFDKRNSLGTALKFKHDGDSGMDLEAYLPESPMIISIGSRALVPTGIHIAIPLGYEGQVRSRSGLAINKGIFVLNSPGTIDSGYRGEIKVVLQNIGNEAFMIHDGDRIAQLVIAPIVSSVILQIVNVYGLSDLGDTSRNEAGFGSTGV